MAKKNKFHDLYEGGDPNEVDVLGRELAYAIAQDPAISVTDLMVVFKCSRQAIDIRIKSKDFKAFQIRLESSLWDQIAMARSMAMKNAQGYLKKPDTQAALEMAKMFLKTAADHPSTLPVPEAQEPEFYTPDAKAEG